MYDRKTALLSYHIDSKAVKFYHRIPLCIHIDLKPRFELNRQLLIVDRDLLDQPSDQSFGVFRYFRCLLIKEGNQVIYLVPQSLPCSCIRKDSLPLFTQADDGISNLIDFLLVVTGAEQLCLPLFDLPVDFCNLSL